MPLSPEQNDAWRSLVMLTHVLDSALDQQSQRDGGLPHAYYKVLVFLYETPDRRLPMGELARQQRYSTSRMTHAITAMEKSGWVRRIPSPTDRRVRLVELTEEGIALVRAVSPKQAVEVRERAFTHLDTVQVAQLQALSLAIVDNLDRPVSGHLDRDGLDGDGD